MVESGTISIFVKSLIRHHEGNLNSDVKYGHYHVLHNESNEALSLLLSIVAQRHDKQDQEN